jgi:pimeloyl-ACP methyl ester carboxylesterase
VSTTPADSTQPFTLRGAGTAIPEPTALQLRAVGVERITTFAPATRSNQPTETAIVNPDDLIEVEFESGERLWMRGDDYRARFAPLSSARDLTTGQPLVDVAIEMPMVATGLVSRDTRGAASWVVKSLKVIGIDLAGKSALAIGRLVEGKKTDDGKRPGLGLFHCGLETGAFRLTTPTVAASDGRPWLLFIHGTGSTTWGSFGELWSTARSQQLAKLRGHYGDRVLAFEHRTLTHSPIRNAADLLGELARVLPGGGTLDLVTHSRGGLVGELLARSDFSGEEIELFQPRDDRQINADDQRTLAELNAGLRSRAFPVRRFVRVACPALGTTLASGRLDRWLSVIGTLAGFLPGTPLADVFADLGDFVAAVVQERTNPETLPGIEAMMPDSQCIKLVNWPATSVESSLAVIAGDIDPAKWWARLAVWLSDRFYEGDHDLVVNTPSMYGGASRAGRAVVSFHKAEAVNHFTYFSEAGSADRLVTALTASDDQEQWPGFLPLHPPKVPIAREVQAAESAGRRPAVFVLPGIMGSELAVGDRSIWVSVIQLLRGGLADLHIDAADVRPSKPVERYYGALCRFLEKTHDVLPFAYDWRVDIGREADRLAASVRAQLARTRPNNQPIRLLAHSMGGLVTRAMIARHPDVWREICEHPDARFVMLGTPNGGSHSIPELLVGQSVVFRKLARLDVRHRADELLRVIGRFPGILAMLPEDVEANLFSTGTWESFHARAGAGWFVPEAARLEAARAIRRTIADSPLDPARMIYVAGSADVTVAAMRVEKRPGESRERIVFMGTTRGDGRVTWDTGIPKALAASTYYMDVQHGDMAADERSFPAIDELLTRGETRQLSRTQPVAREAAVLFEMPPAEDDRYPDADDLTASVVGAGVRAQVRRTAPTRAVRVRVVHGNLAFASHSVAVGHYTGDTIVSAEKHLDRALQFALTQRLHLGLYPGAIETNAIFTNPQRDSDPYARPAGAIVVGLGTVGSLTASSLTRSFSRALLEFVLEQRKRRPAASTGASIPVSTLLIGTGAGGMAVSDSVFALVRGAQRANEALAAAEQPDRIEELEFIELYHDRAVLALESLDRLSRRVGVADAFTLMEGLITRDGGLHRVTYDEEPEWWQRLQILGKRPDDGSGEPALRFAALTRRARTEVRLLPTQRTLVDQFIERTLATTRHDKSVARTLFDLLLPNELKESAPDQDNLVLLLDDESARYPWELLESSDSRGQGPFAIDHGLLRQLEARDFREQVRGTVERAALVVGDPQSSYVELKGAQLEAEAVARVLQGGFTTVTKRVRPASQQVITALFERPYQVMHLAGHGVYRFTPPGQQKAVTGMVIGDDTFLTPGEIAQLRSVPELVFVNCCHLGRVEDTRAGTTPQELAFPQLAANLATEFIRMGVRAVVAAGWAVEDLAATTFATTFYQQMLSGETYGDAVKAARKATYDQHGTSNTWGAYQCYGDPDFRLVFRRERLAQQQELRYLSPAHVVRDLGNITARLKTHSSMGREEELRQLDAIVQAVEKKRWTSGAILAGLGRAYGEAGRLDRAVHYYCAAFASEDGQVTAKDVEQWANLTGRLAMERVKASPDDDALRVQASADLRRSIRVLRGLLGGVRGGRETVERLALIGSAYKRRAIVDPARRADSLRRMAEFYGRSVATARARGRETAYSIIGLRWAELAMRWQGIEPPAILDGDLSSDLERIRQELTAREQAEGPQFWQDNMRVDCDLLEAMADGVPDDVTLAEIGNRYLSRRKYASAREFASVVDHLDFLVTMSEADEHTTLALRNLRERIRTVKADQPEVTNAT